jgi:hypothetical protein
MAASTAVLAWAGRHIMLWADEFTFYQYFHDLHLRSLLTPHNAHLILVPRFIYAAIFQAVGPSHAALAVVALTGLLLAAGLFFVLAARRVRPLVALALTIPLLFLGSSWDVVLSTLGIQVLWSVATGLGMLVALERRDLRGDIAACLLLSLSIASFTLGLAFLVAAAISVLVPPDRRRRAWIFLLPLLAYAIWWIWAQQFHQTSIQRPSNILLIPNFIADSFAAVSGSIAGLNYPIGSSVISSAIDIGWGRVLTVVALVALCWRLRRGDLEWRRGPEALSLWAILSLPIAYWALIAIEASPTRTPEQTRYLYPGAVLVLLLVAEALRGVKFSRTGVIALFGVVVLSLAANLRALNDARVELNDFTVHARADLAMIELSRSHVNPGLSLADASPDLNDPVNFPVYAGSYIAAADDVGSLALPAPDLPRQAESVRADADAVLVNALALRAAPAGPPPSLRGCDKEPQGSGSAVVFELPPGGALLGLGPKPPTTIGLRRFADSYATVAVPPGARWVTLRIPQDASSQPWWLAASSPGPVTSCPLP